MGKPVIMTKTQFIDLDIEKEGIGIWVESGDVEGWRNAIEKIYSDENLAQEMGLKARKLAESRFNYKEFSYDVIRLLEKVVQKDKSN
jgi:glycosyltransferase involved in cell wall biosynthesis